MNHHRILFVDDDAKLLAAFQRTFRKEFTFDTAIGGEEALQLLAKQGPYALLVVDMQMPLMDGIEFLEQARPVAPHAVTIMLTGNADRQTELEALNRGHVFKFLSKPCPPEMLLPAIRCGLEKFERQSRDQELCGER